MERFERTGQWNQGLLGGRSPVLARTLSRPQPAYQIVRFALTSVIATSSLLMSVTWAANALPALLPVSVRDSKSRDDAISSALSLFAPATKRFTELVIASLTVGRNDRYALSVSVLVFSRRRDEVDDVGRGRDLELELEALEHGGVEQQQLAQCLRGCRRRDGDTETVDSLAIHHFEQVHRQRNTHFGLERAHVERDPAGLAGLHAGDGDRRTGLERDGVTRALRPHRWVGDSLQRSLGWRPASERSRPVSSRRCG